MHAYLATVCRDLGAELVHVGGVADHVHIVTTLPRTLSQADLVERIKKTFSKSLPSTPPPLPASGARRNGAAYRVHTVEKLVLLRACQARGAHRQLA